MDDKRPWKSGFRLCCGCSNKQGDLFSGGNRVKFQCSKLLVHEMKALVNGPPVKEKQVAAVNGRLYACCTC